VSAIAGSYSRGVFSPAKLVLLLLLWGSFFIKFPLLFAAGLGLGVVSAFYYVTENIAVDRVVGLVGANILFWC